jgi:hypothetical protein
MTENVALERRMLAEGALDPLDSMVRDEHPEPAEVERFFVLGKSLLSELHELVKWCIRSAGLRLERLVARPDSAGF